MHDRKEPPRQSVIGPTLVRVGSALVTIAIASALFRDPLYDFIKPRERAHLDSLSPREGISEAVENYQGCDQRNKFEIWISPMISARCDAADEYILAYERENRVQIERDIPSLEQI